MSFFCVSCACFFVFSCQYQYNWLPRNTHLQKDPLCVTVGCTTRLTQLTCSLFVPFASVSSDRQHLSYDGCLEVRGEIIRTVLCCIVYWKLCTVISTLRWAVLTVLWIGFCLTRPIPLCVDSFVYIFFSLYCLTAYVLYYCNMVGWTWWDWSLILEHLPSVLWHCWLGHLIRKNPSPIWPIMCSVGR